MMLGRVPDDVQRQFELVRQMFDDMVICGKCQPALDIVRKDLNITSFDLDHHTKFSSLQASADAGCHLCQTIWQYIVATLHHDEPFPDLELTEWKLTYYPFVIKVQIAGADTPPTAVRIVFNTLLCRGPYWMTKDLYAITHPTEIKASLPGPQNTTLKELIQTDIWPWIKNCQSQHQECEAPSVNSPLPTRLIEVGSEGAETVKLIQTDLGRKDITYLALSYCWGRGTSNNKARTTLSNLSSRLQGIVTDTLPKTIQDAITLTRLMGVKYLWVDAVCIIQPEGPDSCGDWETEAGKMGAYYSGALCCIAASRATSSEQGFLKPRPLGRYPIRSVLVPRQSGRDYQWATFRPELDCNAFRNDPQLSSMPLINSPLMERGWCHQERVLSRRVLHWTWAGLFKECRTMQPLIESQQKASTNGVDHILNIKTKASEVLTMQPVMENQQEAFVKRRMDETLNMKRQVSTSFMWFKMVERYSEMGFTYPGDRLPAIWGIASALSQKYQDQYFYGIFKSCLVRGLLWSSTAELTQDNKLPTWSWMSVSGPVEYNTMPHDADEDMTRHILPDPFPIGHGLSSLGDRSDHALQIEAPLLTLTTEESLDVPGRMVIKKDSATFGGWLCTYAGRTLKRKDDEGLTVLLLNRRPEADSLYGGLVLLRNGDEWERVGYIGIQRVQAYKRRGRISFRPVPDSDEGDLSKFVQWVTLI